MYFLLDTFFVSSCGRVKLHVVGGRGGGPVLTIRLMCDYVTCSKFTTEPRLRDVSQTFVLFVLFSGGCSFHLSCFLGICS